MTTVTYKIKMLDCSTFKVSGPAMAKKEEEASTSKPHRRKFLILSGQEASTPYGPHLPGGDASAASAPENQPSTSRMGEGGETLDEVGEAEDENSHRYVGLVNQAMTCYLNSVLQSLFMTPEFRNALFRFEFSGSREEETKSIPFQLQKIFLLLQTSEKSSLETKDLTVSFGWDRSDAWEQHDVQELCRLMFEALERKWKNTKQASLIDELYRGVMKDYVKCAECERENVKDAFFSDLPLAIRPFGSSKAFSTIEEALEAFIKPELLDGSNQYECERCQKKTDAAKGLKIAKFPYLLTIQLKRFDFDYTTLTRKKLNDRMTFPSVLNLNKYVAEENRGETVADSEMIEGQASASSDSAKKKQLESEDEGISLASDSASGGSPTDDFSSAAGQRKDDLISMSIDKEKVRSYLRQGPYVYELFSIMVHSGSAIGGHYFAYIKNVDQNQWYCFNDQNVIRASLEDLHRTYGGPPIYGIGRGYGFSNNNAYMLMYRQINKERNVSFTRTCDLPNHLSILQKRFVEEEEERIRERELRESQIDITAFCIMRETWEVEKIELKMLKTDKLSSLREAAYAAFKLSEWTDPPIPIEQCRLVKWEQYRRIFGESLEENMDDTIKFWFPWSRNVLLEWHCKEERLRHYSESGNYYIPECTTMVIIPILDIQSTDHKRVLYQWVAPDDKVNDIRHAIIERCKSYNLKVPEESELRIVHRHSSTTLRLLDDPEKDFRKDVGGYFNEVQLFVDMDPTPLAASDRTLSFADSQLYRILDEIMNLKRVKVHLPTHDEFRRAGFTVPTIISEMIKVHDDSLQGSVDSSIKDSANHVSDSANADERENKSTGLGETGAMLESLRSKLVVMGVDPSSVDPQMDVSQPILTPSPQLSPMTSDYEKSGSAGDGLSSTEISPEKIETGEMASSISSIPPPPPPPPSLSCSWKSPYRRQSDAAQDDDENKRRRISDQIAENPEPSGSALSAQPISSSSEPLEEIAEEDCEEEYPFKIVDKTVEGDDHLCLELEVDQRMSVAKLKDVLKPLLGLQRSQFSVVKSMVSAFYDITNETQLLKDCIGYCALGIKLGRNLKEGETIAQIYQFDVHKSYDEWPILFDVIISPEVKVKELLQQCHTMLKRVCDRDVPVERLRLRERRCESLPIIRDESTVFSLRFSPKLLLQILDEPDVVGADPENHFALFVRRWSPRDLTLGPIKELVLRQDVDFDGIRAAISHISAIPTERVEISEENRGGYYPYEVDRLHLLEEATFHSKRERNECQVQDDGQLFYYRDAEEKASELSAEKRKEIQIKDSANLRRAAHSYSNRKERALKIYTETSLSIADDDLNLD